MLLLMGQQEIYIFLKKHRKKWFFAKEIANKLRVSPGSVLSSLKRLRKAKMVNYKLAKKSTGWLSKRVTYVYGFRK